MSTEQETASVEAVEAVDETGVEHVRHPSRMDHPDAGHVIDAVMPYAKGAMLSLVLDGGDERALAVLRREHGRMDDMTQVISFQTLALQLGASFLEEERYYPAITSLQLIWPSARLLDYQNAKLEEIHERIAVLEQRPNTRGIVFQLQTIRKRVERELARILPRVVGQRDRGGPRREVVHAE